ILYGRNPVLEALRAGRPARKIVIAAAVRPEARLAEILEHAEARDILVEEEGNPRDEAVLASVRLMRIGFDEAMDDDLNLPEAMGIVFSGLRDVNRVLDSGPVSAETQRTLQHLLADVDDVLGVLALVARDRQAAPDAEEQRWLDERAAARAARDFAQSDHLRAQLAARGIEVEDTPQGQRWKRTSPRRG
ncbi:MAG TPA: DALR domain-containing protein, partial [Polyangiaceae bacterium]